MSDNNVPIAITQGRPPYIRFGLKPIEDRSQDQGGGMYGLKDVPYAFVTPAGSKDCFEFVAEEWLLRQKQQVAEERIPQAWLEYYQNAYRAWKANEEAPVNGLSLRNWAAITPAQLGTCLAVGIRSVEDLAAANEEAIGRLGMGGRVLVDKAKDFLNTKDGSKIAGDMEALRVHLNRLETENKDLVAKNGNLESLVKDLRTQSKATTTAIGATEQASAGGDNFMKDI